VNAGTSIQGIIDLNRSSLPEIDPLTSSLTSTFSSFPNENLLEAVEYSINYLSNNKENFNLSDQDLLAGIKSSVIAFLNSSESTGSDLLEVIPNLPGIVFKNLIPVKVDSWGGNIPTWAKELSITLMESISEASITADKNELKKLASKATTSTVLQIINDSTIKSNGLLPSHYSRRSLQGSSKSGNVIRWNRIIHEV